MAAGESSSVPATTRPTTVSTSPEATVDPTLDTALDTGDVAGYEVGEILVAGTVWTVAIADDPDERARGLMGVADLGDLDGMLFVFEPPELVTFWMKDTLIDLDIAFFDGEGTLIEVLTMPTCETDSCPTYASGEPVGHALEAPVGDLHGLPAGAVLDPSP